MGTDLQRSDLRRALGEPEEGYALVARDFDAPCYWIRIILMAFALTLLAEACNRHGRTTEGLSYLTEAEQMMETTNDAFAEAELHRARGDLLNTNGDVAGAEPAAKQAIAVAKRQSAKIFEFEPPPALPVSGAIKASGMRLASFSLRSTAGLPKGSIRSI